MPNLNQDFVAEIESMQPGDRLEIQRRPNGSWHIVTIMVKEMSTTTGESFEEAWNSSMKWIPFNNRS